MTRKTKADLEQEIRILKSRLEETALDRARLQEELEEKNSRIETLEFLFAHETMERQAYSNAHKKTLDEYVPLEVQRFRKKKAMNQRNDESRKTWAKRVDLYNKYIKQGMPEKDAANSVYAKEKRTTEHDTTEGETTKDKTKKQLENEKKNFKKKLRKLAWERASDDLPPHPLKK